MKSPLIIYIIIYIKGYRERVKHRGMTLIQYTDEEIILYHRHLFIHDDH